jgi:regulator of RNase E activity RraA
MLTWGPDEASRLAAIREELAQVSTATAYHMLLQLGWRNTFMQGLLPIQELGLGRRVVGRARTLRFLMRRGPDVFPKDETARAAAREARRTSPEVVLIESLEPGDVFCVDALGVRTSGIVGDILTTRIQARGAVAAVIHGVIRDLPFVKSVGLPLFCAGSHPAPNRRDLVPVELDSPVDMAGVHVLPGDVILADDEGVMAMPLDLAEQVAAHGPDKERLELWIRDRIAAGGSVHDYYPPSPEKAEEYTRETGRTVRY